jgi:hypothetical protein
VVTIARAFDPVEARLIVATLANAGISANALWVETLSNHWSQMLALGGIAIEIAADDVADATTVLAEIEPAPPPRGGIPLLLVPFVVLPLLVLAVALPLRLRAELPQVEQTT